MAISEIKTEAEIREIIQLRGFKHAALSNLNQKKLINYNGIKSKIIIEDQINNIFNYLASSQAADGVYIIEARTNMGRGKISDVFYFQKGEVTEDVIIPKIIEQPTPQQPQSQEQQNQMMLDYEEALKIQVENAELKLKIEQLEQQVDQLEAEIEELESEEAQEKGMGENTTTFLKELIAQSTPLVDQLLQQRNKKLELEEAKLTFQIQQAAGTLNNTVNQINQEQNNNWQDEFNALIQFLENEDLETYNMYVNQWKKSEPEKYHAFVEFAKNYNNG